MSWGVVSRLHPLLALFMDPPHTSIIVAQCSSEMPPVLLGIPWPALRGPLRNHYWKKRRPRPYWGGENSGNALEASNALNCRAWGSQPDSQGESPGNALRAFPGSFRIFSGTSALCLMLLQSIPLGCWIGKICATDFLWMGAQKGDLQPPENTLIFKNSRVFSGIFHVFSGIFHGSCVKKNAWKSLTSQNQGIFRGFSGFFRLKRAFSKHHRFVSETGIGGVKMYRTLEGKGLATKVAPRRLGLFDPQIEDFL